VDVDVKVQGPGESEDTRSQIQTPNNTSDFSPLATHLDKDRTWLQERFVHISLEELQD